MFVFLCFIAIGFIFLSDEIKKSSIGPLRCAAIVAMFCAISSYWVLWNVRPEIQRRGSSHPENFHPEEQRVKDYKTALLLSEKHALKSKTD
jgi:hypothetical protein